MRLRPVCMLALAVLTAACATGPAPGPQARWTLRGEPLVLRSEPRFAGAVSSLRYRGTEYVDASDPGRLLQGAVSFNGEGECLNPTLAGASSDKRRRSSSRLITGSAGPDAYRTLTRMAYWLRPGQFCTGQDGPPRPAVNTTRLSDVLYAQQLTPEAGGRQGVVVHAIQFTTAAPQPRAVVEALTLYAPPEFNQVHLFQNGRLVPDSTVRGQPGEQARPVVLATVDGRHAIGFAEAQGDGGPRYGRFLFPGTSKINVVFRPEGAYAAGVHSYRVTTVIGSLAEVEATLRALPEDRP